MSAAVVFTTKQMPKLIEAYEAQMAAVVLHCVARFTFCHDCHSRQQTSQRYWPYVKEPTNLAFLPRISQRSHKGKQLPLEQSLQ